MILMHFRFAEKNALAMSAEVEVSGLLDACDFRKMQTMVYKVISLIT